MKKISIFLVLLMLSMLFSSSIFASEQESALSNELLDKTETRELKKALGVEYRGHIQNVGDFPLDEDEWIPGPMELGTEGRSLRLEGFWIRLNGEVPKDFHISYRVHVQNVGWMDWKKDGEFAGTRGKSQQIESLEIKLVDGSGMIAKDYSVSYRGHVQNIGDVGPYKNGQQLGTDGQFLRLEAIKVEIVKNKPEITISGSPKTSLVQGETVSGDAPGALVFKIVDQYGNPLNLAPGGDSGLKVNLSLIDPDHVLLAPTPVVLLSFDMSTIVGTTKGIDVRANDVNGTATIQAQLFNDMNVNNKMDSGEEIASLARIVYTVSSRVLTRGVISDISSFLLVSDKTVGAAAPNSLQVITYELQDQAGNPFPALADTNVIWTITNTATTAITVNTDKTLAGGDTASYTRMIKMGDTENEISILSVDPNLVKVSTVADSLTTPANLDLYFYDLRVDTAANPATYTGRVLAFEIGYVLLDTNVGRIVADTDKGTARFMVDGNTVSRDVFQDAVKKGDTLKIIFDGTNMASELTTQ